MFLSGWNSHRRLLPPVIIILLLAGTTSATAFVATGGDSLVVNSAQTPADRRSRITVCYSDSTYQGIQYQLLENYSRFHNLTSTSLKQENLQEISLTKGLFPGTDLLMVQHSEFYHERDGRRLFDGTLLSGGRFEWQQLILDLAGGAVSRLRDENHTYGPVLQVEALQQGQLSSRILLLMENPGDYRERKALLTSNGSFVLNELVQDQLSINLDYDQSTQDWVAGTSQRKSLREQAVNSLSYRVNSHTTVFAVSTLQFSRLEQSQDNHRRLGWEQQLRHHYQYGGLRLRTTFSLQRHTAEAELNQERRFSEIARNLLRLEAALPLWFSDTLQLSGMIDRLNHDTDLYGSGALQNEITDQDYRDERLLRGSMKHQLYRQRWGNELSLVFRSRELNNIYADKSDNNHTAVNLVVGEQLRFHPWRRWELKGGLEMLSAWRRYHYESDNNLRSHLERGFRANHAICFFPQADDTLQLNLSASYEDGGLYNYEDHIEYRSHSADENHIVLSWSHRYNSYWWGHGRVHFLQRHDWSYNSVEEGDRSLRRRLRQLNGRVELTRASGLTLQTGFVYSWGMQVATRLDWIYQLNWQVSF
jgi:hypothetical protein